MKKAIIFGDSYSTFSGHIPEGYPTYYPRFDVDSVEKTWWKMLSDKKDIKLVQNNSWSGSPLGFTGYNNTDCSRSGSFIARYRELRDKGFFEKNAIDTVFVFGGTNDNWADVPLGDVKFDGFEDNDPFCILPAICYFTETLKRDLPDAEIVLIVNTELKPEIQECFETAAKHYGVKCVRLQNIDKESGHPIASGMQAICKQVAAVLS